MLAVLFGNVDWGSMFAPKHALVDSVIRGTAIYVSLFLMLRFLKNRSIGGVGLSDLLTVILIANAMQNGLIGKGSSITEGLVSTLTIIAWSSGVDRLAFWSSRVRRFVHSPPVELVQDGASIPDGLRKEMMSEESLLAQLRIGGIATLSEVQAAFVEANGQVSILKR